MYFLKIRISEKYVKMRVMLFKTKNIYLNTYTKWLLNFFYPPIILSPSYFLSSHFSTPNHTCPKEKRCFKAQSHYQCPKGPIKNSIVLKQSSSKMSKLPNNHPKAQITHWSAKTRNRYISISRTRKATISSLFIKKNTTSTIFSQYFYNKSHVISYYWFKFEFIT